MNNNLIIILFLSPLASHCAREYFAYNKPYFKLKYNINDEKLALFDLTFMITYSFSLLINGYICNNLKSIKFKILHLNIALFGCSISFLLFTYYFNILIWFIHAIFTSALWPISFSISIENINNNLIKCLWTLNGPIGDYLSTFISHKYNYIISLIYILCLILNILIFYIKNNHILFNYFNNNENLENSSFINYVDYDSFTFLTNLNSSNKFLQICKNIKKYFKLPENKYLKLLNLIFISFYIKTITYSTSNWLPNINNNLYNYYSLFTIFGTLLIGIKTLYIKKINILLIILCYLLFFIYFIQFFIPIVNHKFIYGIIGILQSEISTLISILICEKNKDLVNGLALMTSIMDFSGTIGNALMQLLVFNNLELYLMFFSGLLALFVTCSP